ncbi:MAG: hypothetical protein IPG68_14885 [Micrococcales bacterium]|nr:hypothetical protein [Micrococcales bacterium]
MRSPAAIDGPLQTISIDVGIRAAARRLEQHGVSVAAGSVEAAQEFITGRFAQLLRDEGVSADLVAAVMPGALSLTRPDVYLAELAQLADDDDFAALVQAVVRCAGSCRPEPAPELVEEHRSLPAECGSHRGGPLPCRRTCTPGGRLRAAGPGGDRGDQSLLR